MTFVLAERVRRRGSDCLGRGGGVCIPSRQAAEKRDDENDENRDARGKAQAYWAGKLQQLTQRNNNGGMAAPMAQYLSHANERPTKKRPAQRDGVLTGRIEHGISAADRGSSDVWHPPCRG